MLDVKHDYAIIGGGIIGFSTAYNIYKLNKNARIVIFEKEPTPGFHQTGRNSGVIHAGVYYKPGSLKAILCRKGLNQTKLFCAEHALAYEESGKLIVATNKTEEERISDLYSRANANGLNISQIGPEELYNKEPNISGISALFSPNTAITNYKEICLKIAEICAEYQCEIYYNAEVDYIKEQQTHVEIGVSGQTWKAQKLIVCAGLQSDRLAKMSGLNIDFHVIPFRGEYYILHPSKNSIINHLIYPAPDPSLPFLGVHLTKMIDGTITIGPNAVIGFSREIYQNNAINYIDFSDYVLYKGFWRLLSKHYKHALNELHTSLSKKKYLKEVNKYCPSLNIDDLVSAKTGIRAQVVLKNGDLEHDFLFVETRRMLHVCNAPSPAATSAIPIGEMIANKSIEKSAT